MAIHRTRRSLRGTPDEHKTRFRDAFHAASSALREMQARSRIGSGSATSCETNMRYGADLLRAVGRAESHLEFITPISEKTRSDFQRQLYTMTKQGQAILDRCVLRGEAALKARRAEAVDAAITAARRGGTVSGARRRRKR